MKIQVSIPCTGCDHAEEVHHALQQIEFKSEKLIDEKGWTRRGWHVNVYCDVDDMLTLKTFLQTHRLFQQE